MTAVETRARAEHSAHATAIAARLTSTRPPPLRSRVREVRDGAPDARALAIGPSAGSAMRGYIRGAGRGDRTLAEAAGCYGSAPGVAGICPCELPRRNLHTQSGDPVLSRLALDRPDGAHASSGRRSARSARRSPGGSRGAPDGS